MRITQSRQDRKSQLHYCYFKVFSWDQDSFLQETTYSRTPCSMIQKYEFTCIPSIHINLKLDTSITYKIRHFREIIENKLHLETSVQKEEKDATTAH